MAGTHFSRQGTLGVCRVYVCGIMGALMASGHPFPTFLAIDQTLCIEIQKSEIQGRKKLRQKKERRRNTMRESREIFHGALLQ